MSFLGNLFKKNNEEELEIKNSFQEQSENEDEIAAVIAAVVASMDEEEEIVAAITAAIACILGTSTNDFIVRNIKRTPEMDSIWANAGRMKLMR
ncbi:MAG: sodium pump decarboxylase subunit gamma [Sedimentibacter sp.]